MNAADRPVRSSVSVTGGRRFYGAGPPDGSGLQPIPWPRPAKPRRPWAPARLYLFLRTRAGAQKLAVHPTPGLSMLLGLHTVTSEGVIQPAPVVSPRIHGFRSTLPWDDDYALTPATV